MTGITSQIGLRAARGRSWLARGAEALAAYLRERRERAQLAQLASWDSRSLADLGLTRAQVEWALALPMRSRASRALARAARARASH